MEGVCDLSLALTIMFIAFDINALSVADFSVVAFGHIREMPKVLHDNHRFPSMLNFKPAQRPGDYG